MEDYKWILITLLSFAISLVYDISRRNKDSSSSPIKFDMVFYIKDNWVRIIVSVLLSSLIAILVRIIEPEIFDVDENMSRIGILIYVIIGSAPDLLIAYAKRNTDFLRPETVETKEGSFERRDI